jgi:hypothetical protein
LAIQTSTSLEWTLCSVSATAQIVTEGYNYISAMCKVSAGTLTLAGSISALVWG